MNKTKIKGTYKNIAVSQSTHKLLASYGSKNETFDEILQRILKVYGEQQGQSRNVDVSTDQKG